MSINLKKVPNPRDSKPNKYFSPYCKNMALVGREQELNDLIAFMNTTDQFLWLMISGASGVGKSKLCYEFVQKISIESTLVNDSWDVYLYDCINNRSHNVPKFKAILIQRNSNESNHLYIFDSPSIDDVELGEFLNDLIDNPEIKGKTRVIITVRSIPRDWRNPYSYTLEKECRRNIAGTAPASRYPFLANCEDADMIHYAYGNRIPSMILNPLSEKEIKELIKQYLAFRNNSEGYLDENLSDNVYSSFTKVDSHFKRPLIALLVAEQLFQNQSLETINAKLLSESIIENERMFFKRLYSEVNKNKTSDFRFAMSECIAYASLFPDTDSKTFKQDMQKQLAAIEEYFCGKSAVKFLSDFGLLHPKDNPSYVHSYYPEIVNELIFLDCMYQNDDNRFRKNLVFQTDWQRNKGISCFLKKCYFSHPNHFTNIENLKETLFDESYAPKDSPDILPYLELLSSFVDKELSGKAVQFLQKQYDKYEKAEYALPYLTSLANAAYYKEPSEETITTASIIYEKFKSNTACNERIAEQYARFLRYLAQRKGLDSLDGMLALLKDVYNDFQIPATRNRYAKALLQKPNHDGFTRENEPNQMFQEYNELYKGMDIPLDVLEYEVIALRNCLLLSQNAEHCSRFIERLKDIVKTAKTLEDLDILYYCCEAFEKYICKFSSSTKENEKLISILEQFKDYPQERFKQCYQQAKNANSQPKKPEPNYTPTQKTLFFQDNDLPED